MFSSATAIASRSRFVGARSRRFGMRGLGDNTSTLVPAGTRVSFTCETADGYLNYYSQENLDELTVLVENANYSQVRTASNYTVVTVEATLNNDMGRLEDVKSVLSGVVYNWAYNIWEQSYSRVNGVVSNPIIRVISYPTSTQQQTGSQTQPSQGGGQPLSPSILLPTPTPPGILPVPPKTLNSGSNMFEDLAKSLGISTTTMIVLGGGGLLLAVLLSAKK